MNKSTVIGAAVLAVSICVLGLCIKAGIDNFAFRDRVVTVRGLAERTVEADYVTWPMNYAVAGDDLSRLYNEMQTNNDIVVKFLTDNGIERDEISVNPPDLYNAAGNVYGGDRARYQYNLNVTITVATKKVAKVRELITRQSELLKKGVAVSNNYINYQFTGLNSVKPEMIAEATKNARVAADQFASDSSSKVGKIKTATQGQFSISDADSSTPQLKNVRVVSTIVYYLED
ncbi:MAG: SIMPL domain-containing protein [Muribaculaceae bacterium]|nr:SIMPL domain-containing protein [Muribaculaceae bacterium]MDE6166070.1 SIMPL domain-containing protein [Muribaculaceae bacterium]